MSSRYKYTIKDIRAGIRNPKNVIKESKFWYEKFKYRYKYGKKQKRNPLTDDYDNLIILDACRYDTLKKLGFFSEEVGYRILSSSTSPEFCEKYMSNNKFHDTIYVTANPYGAQVADDIFYDKFITFKNSCINIDGYMSSPNNPKYETWAPEVVHEMALYAYERYKNKRLILHFMQPHAPYFGEKAKKLRDEVSDKHGITFWAWNKNLSASDINDSDKIISHLLSAAKEGYITTEELIEVYTENLEYVLKYVEKLLKTMDGKTIITSDHGELLEYKLGHGRNMHTEGLCRVPWVVLDDKNRRKITTEEPVQQANNELNIDKQLKALGYKQ
jgi:ketosteroid isomerase-like protein